MSELKLCVNDVCGVYGTDYYDHKCNEKLKVCSKYLTEKPESAWEMFRRLYKKYGVEKIIPLLATITKCAHLDSIMLSLLENDEQEAIKIMKEIEQELKE